MKITFFCNVDKNVLKVNEFYNQDIQILRDLGHQVSIATSYKELSRDVDVIFIWWWTYALTPILFGKIFGVKSVITGTFNFRCPELERDYFKRPWIQKILIRLAFSLTNANILVSKKEFDSIKNEWNPTNIWYSPHIIDINTYKPGRSARASNMIFTLSWMENENIIRKCIMEIIEAAEKVSKIFPEVMFIMAGRDGNGIQKVKAAIQEKNLEKNIRLIGEISLSEKVRYLQECSIYLQPSRYEGFGVAIAEAMSCGAPVISSRIGEVENVVGEAGVLIGDNSIESIANELISLLSDQKRRKELSSYARVRIVQMFPKAKRMMDFKRVLEFVSNEKRWFRLNKSY